MTNLKTTKRALLSSVIALLVCFTMLLGTTFAWFTDSVTSAGNIIQTGTLEIGMYWAEGDETVPTDANGWKDASTGAIFNNTKWEPGYVEAKHIKIANEGKLALKYKLLIVPNGEVEALADVIDVYFIPTATQVTDRSDLTDTYKVGTLRDMIEDTDGAAHGALLPVGTKVDTLGENEAIGEVTATIALKMREEAGNKYKGMSIGTDFSIQLLATQYTFEGDSFDNQYDADAPIIKVNTAEEAQAALDNAEDGTIIYLTEAINYGDLLIRVNEDSELVDYYYVMGNYNTNYYGQAGWQYAKRTINNLTITGVEGATIDSLTTPDARDDAGNAKGTRNNMFEINNLTISNITVNNTIKFDVSNVSVGTSATETTYVPHIKLNGLTIDNCKTTTGGDMASKPGRKLLGIANTGSVSNVKNITVTNCTVTDMYQGVYIVDGENVRVEGNTFTNLTHNAIHINSFCSGDIVIANNTIANVADRPIRFNKVASGTVTIKNNTITNSGDDESEIFRASGMGVDVTWKNNTIDGVTVVLTSVGTDIIGKKPTSVTSADELKAALSQATDGAVIYLNAGTYKGLAFTNPAGYRAKNVTIIGLNGAVIDGINLNNWAPVEQSFVVDGLTIKNVTFTKSLVLSTRVMSNVTVEDCVFLNDACIHQNDGSEKLTNLVVKNCSFVGDKNGNTTAIMLENTENVTVTGCSFKDIDYNVLQAGKLSGTVLFDNNTVNGTGSRVFRLVTVDADMTISNNTITSDGDEAGELAKATNAVEITLKNNTWNGKTDAKVANLLVNITAK